MVTNVTNSSANSTAALGATSAANGATSAQEQTDRFMKLLVAQLNNQDPMNPMDNAQMTSQIAQINTVSGIQQLNDTMKSMAGQFTAMQVLQGSSLIGHDVLTTGNSLTVGSTGTALGAMNLSGNADKVSVQILSPGGQVVDTINLGAVSAGQHTFQWDASKYTSGGTPTFKVTATMGTNSVTATTMSRDTVAAVSNTASGMSVQLQSGASVAYDAIQSIL
jgi:flagellar basal-body rod modification protein FlgD